MRRRQGRRFRTGEAAGDRLAGCRPRRRGEWPELRSSAEPRARTRDRRRRYSRSVRAGRDRTCAPASRRLRSTGQRHGERLYSDGLSGGTPTLDVFGCRFRQRFFREVGRKFVVEGEVFLGFANRCEQREQRRTCAVLDAQERQIADIECCREWKECIDGELLAALADRRSDGIEEIARERSCREDLGRKDLQGGPILRHRTDSYEFLSNGCTDGVEPA